MTNIFYFNLFNIGNHEDEIVTNPLGNKTVFHLDLYWKAHNLETGDIRTFDSASDICHWLNKWEYKPTGEKAQHHDNRR